jgi:hypothetical protein
MQPTPKKKKTTQRFSHPAGLHGGRSTAKIVTYLITRESRAASPARPPAIRQSPKSKSHAQPARGKLHPSSYL